MPKSESSQKRILFSFWDGGWGHLARIRNLAIEALERGHQVGFIVSEKYADELSKLVPSKYIFIIPNRPPNTPAPPYKFPVYSHAFRQAQHLRGLGFDNVEWLTQNAKKEIAAIEKFRPDVIVNDNRSTMRTAAEACGVPVVAIAHTTGNLNGYHLGSWIEPPAHAILPDCRDSFNEVRKSFGLPEIENELHMYNGEANIIPSIPALDPLKHPSPNSYYVGAISQWESGSRTFKPITAPTRHNIFSYIGEPTRPSFGFEDMMQEVIESEPDLGFYVIGDPDKYRGPKVQARQREGSVVIAPFIPATPALSDSSILLTHGGLSSICIALSLGKPVIGVGAFQSEAASTIRHAEQAGVGIYLPHSEGPLEEMKAPDLGENVSIFGHWQTALTGSKIQQAINTVLEDKSYAAKAAELGVELAAYGGVKRALDIIEKASQHDLAEAIGKST